MPTPRFRTFSWAVLGYALVVILWGYFLRVSESGDGCGTDWPLCGGAVVPSGAEFPTWVELIHRLSSGMVLVMVLVMAIWAVRSWPRGHLVRSAALWALVFTITESLFGAVLVVFGWVAEDVSVARIVIRPLHVTNNFLLMGAMGLTAWWSSRGLSRLPRTGGQAGFPGTGAVLAVVLLAATGSWTGLAGTAFPAESVGEGLGQYLDPEHLLIYLRTLHPLLALVAVFLVGRFTLRGWRVMRNRPERWFALALGVLGGTQLLLGPATILLLHPLGLRLLHLFLADLFWICLLLLVSSTLEARAPGKSSSERSYSPHRGSVRTQPGASPL